MKMKMRLKLKNRSHKYDINRPRPRRLYVLRNTYATFEAQFMKKSSNTESRLKQCVAYIKSV